MLNHRRILALIALLLIIILTTLPAFPTSLAQDGTPFLTFEPSPTFHYVTNTPSPIPPTSTPTQTFTPSPTSTPVLASLPFSDTFDNEAGWIPEGAWAFDLATSYASGGWHVDGKRRSTVSTLTYHTLIDMSGALTAQLVYRQMGQLPETDLVTVEVSLDSQNWLILDQQIGIEADWDLHVIDLTNYRGQLIRLRFRVDTGLPVADSSVPVEGYWIDNLTIQYVMLSPEISEIMPRERGRQTLMGLHLILGAPGQPVFDMLNRLQMAGVTLGSLKGTSGTEWILNQAAQISPDTTIIYRSLENGLGMYDCPNPGIDPTIEAQNWIWNLLPYWNGVAADYYEIINECQPPANWLVQFSIEAMRVATENGKCILLFSYSTGVPEPELFEQLQPAFEYALQNPCQPGRHHGIALHAYGYQQRTLVSESGVLLGLRHRMLYAALLDTLPKAVELPLYLTEVGTGDGGPHVGCADIIRDVLQYTQQIEYDPYVRGFDWWTVGPPESTWVDLTPCLPGLSDALISYYTR